MVSVCHCHAVQFRCLGPLDSTRRTSTKTVSCPSEPFTFRAKLWEKKTKHVRMQKVAGIFIVVGVLLAVVLVLALAARQTRAFRSNGRRVSVGDSLVFPLSEHAGTGYSWEVVRNAAISSGAVSVASASIENSPSTAVELPGAPHTRVFRLRANRPGTYTIAFALRRPWTGRENRSVEQRQVYRVDVRERAHGADIMR